MKMAKVMRGKIVGKVLVSLLVVLMAGGVIIMGGLPERALTGAAEKGAMLADSGVAGWLGGALALARPAFAQEIQATGLTFLEKEAGISAYTDVGQRINLVRARAAFRTIERQTDEYIIGSVPLPGKDGYWDVHVFVHRAGWLIAYYHRDWSTGKIIDWGNPAQTNLEAALGVVTAAAGVHFVSMDFYDFRFPDARKLLVITDSDTFRIMIPSEFVVYNRAYSLIDDSRRGWSERARMLINEREIARAANIYGTTIGTISPGILAPGVYHNITVADDGSAAIILTYSER